MVEAAIALGITFNLLLSQLVGFSAAGLVVPGYLALHMGSPLRLAATLVVAVATWAVVKLGLSRLVVLYGRRRLAGAVLVGFVLTAAAEQLWQPLLTGGLDLRVIGHIVPGLIASEALSQGLVPTLLMTLLVAALTRLVLLLVFGWVA